MAGEAVLGGDSLGARTDDGPSAILTTVRRMVREVLAAATDERATTSIERLAGPRWRLGMSVVSVVASAAREALRGHADANDGTGASPDGPADVRNSADIAPPH